MKFRTELKLEKSTVDIDYRSRILCLGSCFAENIGGILLDHKFDTSINPLGIAYNPYSISKHLSLLDETIDISELSLVDGRYVHLDFHGRFNQEDASAMVSDLAIAKNKVVDFLKKTDYVFISLGTAAVFHMADHGIVNNCHKIPNNQFTRKILSYDEIKNLLLKIKDQIRSYKPDAQIIYTLSPIRHIRDGLIQDRRSKSLLHAAIHEVTDDAAISYFPSYELLIDDLRDYRFYGDDLIHPSTEAIRYIWESFQNHYMTGSTTAQIKTVQRINAAVRHRPFNEASAAHQQFLKTTLKNIESLPDLDFQKEKDIILRQMIA